MYITSIRPDQNRRAISVSDVRTLWLSSLGSALEFYDFIIFVFFTAVIGKLFFPSDLPDWLRQLQTYGIFAVGYLARPLGGIVMAHFGDIYGRKRMWVLKNSKSQKTSTNLGIENV
jgi:MFS family permease